MLHKVLAATRASAVLRAFQTEDQTAGQISLSPQRLRRANASGPRSHSSTFRTDSGKRGVEIWGFYTAPVPEAGKARVSAGGDKAWVERKQQKCPSCRGGGKKNPSRILSCRKPHREDRRASWLAGNGSTPSTRRGLFHSLVTPSPG